MNSELRVRIEKWVIWGAIIGVVFLLRHLFPLMFLTFVLTYIGSSVVAMMTRRIPYRRINLAAIYLLLLVALIGLGLVVVPRMFDETRMLARSFVSADASKTPRTGAPAETALDRQTQRVVDAVMIEVLGRESFTRYRSSESYAQLLDRVEENVEAFIPRVIGGVRHFVNGAFALIFQFLLALIFSFLILWDEERLRASVKGFAHGRTAEVYAAVAPSMQAFFVMLGRAFEAQSLIAVINTVLTSIGLFILGIPSIALLAPIVFFCSYIPVFGVVLSSLPAALLAFRTGGVMLVVWLVVMVLIVHAIEAYGLNPLIFGRHLRMHPVAVLVILLVAEHLFGVWGLLLAVPIAAFVLRYVIRGEEVGGVVPPIVSSTPAPAAKTTT